jgi:hypothetical protein
VVRSAEIRDCTVDGPGVQVLYDPVCMDGITRIAGPSAADAPGSG